MTELNIAKLETGDKNETIHSIARHLEDAGYTLAEINADKPWGAYLRLDGGDAEKFCSDFFPSISFSEAQLGNPDAELSPKILLVEPNLRLSWQKHARRAECWTFLTDGYYHRSDTDDEADRVTAPAGEFVQFAAEERHRLVGNEQAPTIVAEIWQHTDAGHLSDENDIVRISDDFSR